jgi:hypothetical protein
MISSKVSSAELLNVIRPVQQYFNKFDYYSPNAEKWI